MAIACPQCGAPAPVLTETRFYRCAYCSSAFIAQGEQGIEQFTISHQRDDRLAWSALAEHLERNGGDGALEQGHVEFLRIPFWCFTCSDGSTSLVPARSSDLPELSRVTLPGGDLRYPLPDEEFPPPEVALAEAERGLTGSPVSRRFLVYLPLYILSYQYGGAPLQALVSGIDGRVYSRHLPAGRTMVIPRRHLLLMGLYAVILAVESVCFRRPEWRAAAFVLTGVVAWFVYGATLRGESR